MGIFYKLTIYNSPLICLSKPKGMQINRHKSSIFNWEILENELYTIENILSAAIKKIIHGLKYMGFIMKPCHYLIQDWVWLLEKNEKKKKNLEQSMVMSAWASSTMQIINRRKVYFLCLFSMDA